MPKTAVTALEYEVVRSRDAIEDDKYVVEAIDYEHDGQIYVAIFSGPNARERAEEYAKFKNS